MFQIFSTVLYCSQKELLIEALELSTCFSVQHAPKSLPSLVRAQSIEYKGWFPTVSSWLKAFENLPKNRKGADFALHSGFSSVGSKNLVQKIGFWVGSFFTVNNFAQDLPWQEFKQVLDAWLAMNGSGPLSQNTNWSQAINNSLMPEISFFDLKIKKPSEFVPFAQKLIAQQGDVFYLHGDLHGDIFSLLEELKALKNDGVLDDDFRIIGDNIWIVFLGDYVDRGQYGCEVIYTMMRLALANPDRVIAVRGNHEDVSISTRYGFKDEVKAKFQDDNSAKYLHISRMNDFLPVVFYVGCDDGNGVVNYVQCCHGGIEEEYDPKAFLDNVATKYQLVVKQNAAKFNAPTALGLLWSDFEVVDQSVDKLFNPGRGFQYGKVGTERVLDTLHSSTKSKIRGIFRAHQHSGDILDPMMRGLVGSNGVYKLWQPYEPISLRKLDDGLVWTFNVGPDSVYGESCGFNFDAYAKLTVVKVYKDWTLQVFNTQVL